ncbi:MAG: AAA family ATPase [Candidatus Poribacteria bacterium]
MRYLYIDNIRGFTDTYIPIKDVNFLVGENSTGKTTILEIMKLLSDSTFWNSQSFDSIKELRFRGYQSIININSQDKSYFRIGMIEHQEEAKDEQSKADSVFLLTFSNQNEMPVISEYCYLSGEYEIKAISHENNLMYKISSVGQLRNSDICQIFKNWTHQEIGNSEGYKKSEILSGPISLLLTIIDPVKDTTKENAKNGHSKLIVRRFIINIPKLAKTGLVWLAPIRSKPKRTYDEYNTSFSPEGDHIPYLLRQILNKKKKSLSLRILGLLNRFGKDSGLFDSIKIKEFGKGLASPFEVDAIINDNPIAISEVGYGIPQALPIIIELLARVKGSWFAIQQPEIHLHPRAQAALGELFYLMAVEEEKRFFIETHSDYIVDRFRMCYQKYDQKDLDSQVLYFERTPTGNKVYPIEIEKTGQYSEDQPPTFRDFFIKEEMALLGV